ncbi:hypothetical protein [Desulfonatronum parangueonense]
MLPKSATRVAEHTPEYVNQQIREQTVENIRQCVINGPLSIDQRLEELDEEWDIERTLQANASTLILMGMGLGALSGRKWFALPVMVSGFLLQHALQGWCPPLSVFRRMGVRTKGEIDVERYALKALRGDFQEFCEKIERGKEDSREAIITASR